MAPKKRIGLCFCLLLPVLIGCREHSNGERHGDLRRQADRARQNPLSAHRRQGATSTPGGIVGVDISANLHGRGADGEEKWAHRLPGNSPAQRPREAKSAQAQTVEAAPSAEATRDLTVEINTFKQSRISTLKKGSARSGETEKK